MSIGGEILEKLDTQNEDGVDVVRYLVKDQSDYTYVMAEHSVDEPVVGEWIWWQGSRIYWDNDRKYLTKVGNSWDRSDND